MKTAPESPRQPAAPIREPEGQGFETLTRRLLAVPKAELDEATRADKERKQGRKSA